MMLEAESEMEEEGGGHMKGLSWLTPSQPLRLLPAFSFFVASLLLRMVGKRKASRKFLFQWKYCLPSFNCHVRNP
jgi:hypothetical protein